MLRFGGHFQHSSKHKQTWREMLTNSSPNKVYQNKVCIYISILCCFIFQGTAKQHDPRLPSKFPYMDLKGFRPSLRDNTLVEKVTKPTLKTVPLSVNEWQQNKIVTILLCKWLTISSLRQNPRLWIYTTLMLIFNENYISPLGNQQEGSLMKFTQTGKVFEIFSKVTTGYNG